MGRGWWLAGLLLAGMCSAATRQVKGRVLGPDGKTPFAGAEVTVRVVDRQLRHVSDTVMRTGEDGWYRTTYEFDPPAQNVPPPPGSMGMHLVIIRAPGYALSIGTEPFRGDDIRLKPDFEVQGLVVDSEGQPVADATITVNTISGGGFAGGLLINVPELGLATRDLVATSAADGSFVLPGFDALDRTNAYATGGTYTVSVVAERDGRKLLGSSSTFSVQAQRPDATQAPLSRRTVRVSSPWLVGGQVVNADGQAVEGAVVRLIGLSNTAKLVQPITTDAAGRFRFDQAPRGDHLFCTAAKDGYAGDWAEANRHDQRVVSDEPAELRLLLRKLVMVRGQVIDPITARPPLTPMLVGTLYNEGYSDGHIAVGRAYDHADADADGRFAIPMPVGGATLGASGIGYRSKPFIPCEVPAAGRDDVVLEAPREPGLLVHFVTAEPEPLKGMFITVGEDDKKPNAGSGFSRVWWFHRASKEARKVTISLLRILGQERQERLAPTSFEYATAPWPVEIPLD